MKAIILNGSDKNDIKAQPIHDIIYDELTTLGWETKSFTLQELRIVFCVGCFQCWEKTPGLCRFDDDGQIIAKNYIQSDLVVFFTPVTFGGHSSILKKAQDRLLPLLSPMFTKLDNEFHHSRRYKKYPILLGAGYLPADDNESTRIFNTLFKRNAVSLHAPYSNSEVFISNQNPELNRSNIRSLLSNLEVSS